MNTMTKLGTLGLLVVAMTGCGTVSEMQTAEGESDPVLPVYKVAVVEAFSDETEINIKDEGELDEHEETLAVAGEHFADLIVAELRKNNLYEEVVRDNYDGEAVRIGGAITRYEEGDAVARFLVGFGAGSSYFDSRITLSDNVTGDRIGEILVDRNSWALGGGLAAGQTVEGYMQGAAKKLVEEIVEAREAMQVFKEARERQSQE